MCTINGMTFRAPPCITEQKVVFPYFGNAPKKYDIIWSAWGMQHVQSDCPVHYRYIGKCCYTSTMLYELSFMTNNKTLEPNVLPSVSFLLL